MSWSGRGGSIRGTRKFRAAADIFDGSTTSIWTVENGICLLTGLLIENLVGALDGTANAVKWTANPTVGSSVDLCATLDVVNDELGTMYEITGILTDALVGTTAGAVGALIQPVNVNVGTIDLVSAGDSNNTNSALQAVTIYYEPVDPGARIVVA
ncbi:MAG TPA: hypothetical protein ENI05_07280 [Porticoccus sp.]|nr:hypothetical protein [Porticoccus sp.]